MNRGVYNKITSTRGKQLCLLISESNKCIIIAIILNKLYYRHNTPEMIKKCAEFDNID